ncbi:twin-arginine translocase TatA/TatE family subunit [Aquisediminimonas profunda]|uniref:twin-arginine translocase TatA/TatE family subunit n=1 Tax=Aquisediminimonas profunda TaxID=1550733 RepID=UPI001C63A92F|nr:twin-arginine translocase TatA/TatE family subunit [Aquisediminimonas profunda]
MMGLSLPHILLLALVVLLLFGGGRVSGLMGDVAKGIKSFKKGLADDDEPQKPMTKIEAQPAPTVIEAEKQTDKQA